MTKLLSTTRRGFMRGGLKGAGLLGLGFLGGQIAPASVAHAAGLGADGFGPLQPPDANNLMLPPGFSSTLLATTGVLVPGTGYTWHIRPDGGATFSRTNGGWIYVSNSEALTGPGGAAALVFDPDGTIVDAYSILSGTTTNCAGGPTPWDTWLSCEEVNAGLVWECDPFGVEIAVAHQAMGIFRHEAAAVDPIRQHVYLTEDQTNGLLYRFTPTSYPDLSAGIVEAAEILDPQGLGPIVEGEVRPLAWHMVANPTVAGGGVQNSVHLPLEERATRFQVTDATSFNRGEGCWYHDDGVYVSSSDDGRVWLVDTSANSIRLLYDDNLPGPNDLTNPDNIYVSSLGDVYVSEDPGNLQIVALTPTGGVVPVIEFDVAHSSTELTGHALSPDGTRLYFSSQRSPGQTFEVTGPFLGAATSVPSLGGLWPILLAMLLGLATNLGLRERNS